MKLVGDKVAAILRAVALWAERRGDIAAAALVGSWARGTARDDSDIDLVLLTPDPLCFRQDSLWPDEIDWHSIGSTIATWRDEEYGVVWSRHLRLADGIEIELGFGPLDWASVNPIDPGTARVVGDGCRILYDPQGMLKELVVAVSRCAPCAPLAAHR